MRAILFAALLGSGCRVDLDENNVPRACEFRPDLPVCEAAVNRSDFEWLQTNIFITNCSGDSCHGMTTTGDPPDGRLLLARGHAYAALMGASGEGVTSGFDPARQLVVPFDAESSYLYFLMRGTPAGSVSPAFAAPPEGYGYMPLKANTLCCEKLEAVRRWIEAGALPPAEAAQ